MEEAYVVEDHLILREADFVDESGELVTDLYDMPLSAVAHWSEILGYSNAVDTVEVMHNLAMNGAPTEAAGAWQETLMVIGHRERAREEEAQKAIEEGLGGDPRSPALRGALAARRAVLGLTGATQDSDSVLLKCQYAARQQLGAPCPDGAPSSLRGQRTLCDPGAHTATGESLMCHEDREAIARVLTAPLDPDDQSENPARCLDLIQLRREEFCHSQTGNPVDPLAPDPTPIEGPVTLDSIRARYAEGVTDA